MEGHIKLHRKMLDWEWYLDIHTKSLFLHLLLKANWKPSRYMGIEVDRGELVSTYNNLASETGLSVKAVRVALNHLIKTGEVTINGQSKFTVIRIENYDAYQTEGKERAEEGQAENEQKAEKGHDKGKQGANIEEEGKKEIKQESKKKAFCPEAETSAPGENVVGSFILNDGSEYNVTENDMELFQKLYPGIDCLQQLRNITGWCLANPKRRKTRSGAKRFLNNWLAREQNSARPEKPSSASNTFASSTPTKNKFHNFDQSTTDYDSLMIEKVRARMAENNP